MRYKKPNYRCLFIFFEKSTMCRNQQIYPTYLKRNKIEEQKDKVTKNYHYTRILRTSSSFRFIYIFIKITFFNLLKVFL